MASSEFSNSGRNSYRTSPKGIGNSEGLNAQTFNDNLSGSISPGSILF